MLEEITEEAYEESHKQYSSELQSKSSTEKQENNSEVIFPISFLMSGNDLYVHSSLKCKHPTIQEILDIDREFMGRNSEKLYYEYVYVFATDPYDCMVLLDDYGIDYEETSSFRLFLFLFRRYMSGLEDYFEKYNLSEEDMDYLINHNIYFKSFNFFFGIDYFVITYDKNNNEILIDKNGNFLLNEEMFEVIHSYIKAINGIEIPEDRIYPENNAVKRMLIGDMREEQEQKERMKKLGIPTGDEDDGKGVLGKYLSALTWGGNGNITPFNRNQLHIFDVVDGFRRTNKKVDFDNIMNGVYSGCVNAKSINFKDLHWTN